MDNDIKYTEYTIDYEYGIAKFTFPKTANAISEFEIHASECFGIRKSIGECTVISESDVEEFPPKWASGESYAILSHNGDVIIWDKDGNKIKSEWD